jgi:hypothetical protein
MNADNPYDFERNSVSTVRRKADAEGDVNAMKVRLQLDDATFSGLEEKLTEFVIQCQRNILWYMNKVKAETDVRRRFFWFTVGLVVAIPIVSVLLSTLGGKNGDSSVVTAQFTALLAGVIGVHRAMVSYLESRIGRALFWQASSDLKQQLYALEGKWRGKVKQGMHDFETDLKVATTKCREILEAEQKAFFAKEAYPSIDLAGTLKSALGDAATTVKGLVVPGSEVEKQRRDLKNTLMEKTTICEKLGEMLEERRRELAAFHGSDAEKKKLEEAITRVMAELETARIDEIKTAAKYQALAA